MRVVTHLYKVGEAVIQNLSGDCIAVEVAVVARLMASAIDNLSSVSSETSGGLNQKG